MSDLDSHVSGSSTVLRGNASPARTAVKVRIPTSEENGEPTVKINRDNDIVRSIEITCVCGQSIQLICEYDQNEASTS